MKTDIKEKGSGPRVEKKIPLKWDKKINDLIKKLPVNKIIQISRLNLDIPISLVVKPNGSLRVHQNPQELTKLVEDVFQIKETITKALEKYPVAKEYIYFNFE